MTAESDALWQAHNELRDRHHALESRMAASEERHKAIVEKLDLSRVERTQQHQATLEAIGSLKNEVAEARGAARFGKFIIGLLITLGAPPALVYWWIHR